MPNVTLAFDELVTGWTSEFTFVPDSGLSLNNRFYTFNNGRLWEHNSENVDRNTFYGITGDTIIKFVFNEAPSAVKNFKTLGYEGAGEWDATLETNIEKGEVQAGWFMEKEGKEYSWIRGEDTGVEIPDLKSAAVQGIGVVSFAGTNQVTFANTIPQINERDLIWRVDAMNAEPQLVGRVSSFTQRTIEWNDNDLGGNTVTVEPKAGELIIVSSSNQEKSGIIGYYNIVTMTNKDVEEAELFSANTSVFISTN